MSTRSVGSIPSSTMPVHVDPRVREKSDNVVAAEAIYYLAGFCFLSAAYQFKLAIGEKKISFIIPAIALVVAGFVIGILGDIVRANAQSGSDSANPFWRTPLKPYLPGQPIPIANMGNTCFINAVIQGIMNDSRIHPTIQKICEKEIGRHKTFLDFLASLKGNVPFQKENELLNVLLVFEYYFPKDFSEKREREIFDKKYPQLSSFLKAIRNAKKEQDFPVINGQSSNLSAEFKNLYLEVKGKKILQEYETIVRKKLSGFEVFLKIIRGYREAELKEPHELSFTTWLFSDPVGDIRHILNATGSTQEDPEELLHCLAKYVLAEEYPDLFFVRTEEKQWTPCIPTEEKKEKSVEDQMGCVLRIYLPESSDGQTRLDGNDLLKQMFEYRKQSTRIKELKKVKVREEDKEVEKDIEIEFEAEEKVILKSYPKTLILDLVRHKNNGSNTKKDTTPVKMPEALTLGDQIFHLKTIVVHSGNEMSQGHHYSLVKKKGTWWCANDNTVVPPFDSDITYALEQGYLYFYSIDS